MEGRESRLAVLFADVAGSARLYERLGDAEADHAVDRCLKRMERAIEALGGRLAKTSGDEIMALFGSAEAACQCAQEMQQRVSDLPPVSGVQLVIRVGFHVGPVTESGGDFSGETLNTAAHVVGMARPGQILTSLQTAAQLSGSLRDSVRDLGQSTGGKGGGVQVVEVSWQKPEETVPPAAGKAAKPAPAREAKEEMLQEAAAVKNGSPRLCLRYRGRAYLLDEKTPILCLGRDAGSDVVIEDRKASRHHARIERRGDRYFYVDRSTNGSYVALAGLQESMVRRAEILLQGSGSICFGASANDPQADGATFEYL